MAGQGDPLRGTGNGCRLDSAEQASGTPRFSKNTVRNLWAFS